ncbi:MAG: hypothetical protein H0T89_06690 [Deltaproteobacteria bacterium]|nr:hypothetical protein [Deltaproteobacteria bacterium]
MARSLVCSAWLLVACAACQPARSTQVRHTGMVMSIGGVGGIIGSALASPYSRHSDELMLASSAISAAGILLFAAHELSGPEVVYKRETLERKHHRWAKVLTEHAAGAARIGNCARVRKFEPRVRVYDPEVHDFVFMRDPEILRCLGAPGAAPAPTTVPDDEAHDGLRPPPLIIDGGVTPPS